MKYLIIILFSFLLACAAGNGFIASREPEAAISDDTVMAKAAEPSVSGAADSGAAPAMPSAMDEYDMEYAAEEMAADADFAAPKSEAKMAAAKEGAEAASNAQERQPAIPEAVYLSADDSNSQASPVIVRRMIYDGRWVQPQIVRTYEFLNYYDFSYPDAKKGDIGIFPEMKKLEEGKYSLQVGLRGWEMDLSERQPVHFIILLDRSGSMAGESSELSVAFLRKLAGMLSPDDRMSLVTVSREAGTIFEYSMAADALKKIDALLEIKSGVGDITNLEKGITRAYGIADRNKNKIDSSRVLILSDGGANAGDYSKEIIAKYAEDGDKKGIYLAGVGFGQGMNDSLMNAFTDKGRGAYIFIDSENEIEKMLNGERFLQLFELQIKDIRLKMQMPENWEMGVFHGEQISTVKSEVIPQYLSPDDQMIYHMEILYKGDGEPDGESIFEFEAEFTPIGGKPGVKIIQVPLADMLARNSLMRGFITKGDALVEFAEMLKKIGWPLDANRESNLSLFADVKEKVGQAAEILNDPDIDEIMDLLDVYEFTVNYGENLSEKADKDTDLPAMAMGLSPNSIISYSFEGEREDLSLKVLNRLLNSRQLVPQQGYKFVCLSSGVVGNPAPAGSGQISDKGYADPTPPYSGNVYTGESAGSVFDLNKLVFKLKAPANARSFSFDFNFFSAEYPDYINQNFNDSFFAVIKAESTNGGKPTNIAFDSNNNSIEVDNNYFENEFHPVSNAGTGFDYHGSTGWLRTSWPILPGEEFTIEFSVHDEGDAIFDSMVVLDNFKWHDYEASGTTDPLN